MAKYTMNPVGVDAIQFKGNGSEVCDWIYAFDEMAFEPFEAEGAEAPKVRYSTNTFYLDKLNGVAEATTGSWIIRGPLGDFYPCHPDVFDELYTLQSEED
jgi:hypothetical protein